MNTIWKEENINDVRFGCGTSGQEEQRESLKGVGTCDSKLWEKKGGGKKGVQKKKSLTMDLPKSVTGKKEIAQSTRVGRFREQRSYLE